MAWRKSGRLNELHTINQALVSAFSSALEQANPDLTQLFQEMKKWRTFISESPAYPKRLLKGCEDLPGIDES